MSLAFRNGGGGREFANEPNIRKESGRGLLVLGYF